ncbi:MAG TPA: alpha-2-macroglobulin family protein [Fimbriimonadaceae bacterium]|nr:alpha-2-macroglobulin family protein [Fimbriimonadaceae bacterium]HRJ97257.1 alpha-2-macroglobulin family protein [Fimbriimonadaceae bacterium]
MRRLFSSGGLVSLVVALLFGTGLIAYGITEEVPLGSIRGVATMAESGRTLKGAVIVLRPTFAIPDWEARSRSLSSDDQGRFSFRNIPAGTYQVEAYTEAHTLEKAAVVVAEGQTSQLDLELQPTQPYLELYASQHVFTPGEKASLQARGFATEGILEVGVYACKFDKIAERRSLYQVLSPVSYENPRVDPDDSPDFTRVKSLQWPIKNRNDEGVFDEYLTFDDLPEGIYWVRAKAGTRQRGTWLLISRIALVTKNAGSDARAYVTDLKTGQPVPGAKIKFSTGASLVEAGSTGADGTLAFRLPAKQPDDNDSGRAVLAQIGASSAICTFYAYDGSADSTTRIWTYTERPVYRPGDEVHFKGIVRALRGNTYALPPPAPVSIQVRDMNETVVQKMSLPLSAKGTFAASFRLTPDVVGYFTIEIEALGGRDQVDVEAMAYRKPEFKITVTPEKASYVRGDRVRMRVKAEYYFGGPVVGAKLSTTVLREPDWGYWGDPDIDAGDEYDGGEGSSRGDYVTEIESVTDGKGEAILDYDTGQDEPQIYDYNDQRMTFEVYGTETGDKYFEGRGSVLVLRGDVSLDLEQSSYVVPPGVPVDVSVKAYQGGSDSPVGGQEVVIETGYQRWTRNEAEFIREGAQTVQTDSTGAAQVKVTPTREGSFLVKASTRDRRGNIVKAEAWVYVSKGTSGGWGGPAPDMQVVLDKRLYRPGDKATVLIRTKASGGSAWVTVESDSILWSAIVPLTSEATTVQIPVTRAFEPNAEVCVAYVKDKTFFQGQRRLSMDLAAKKLAIAIQPSAEVVEPGDTLTYRITTKTLDGTPVAADLSLGVVDESIYAIRPDRFEPVKAFYPVREHAVATNYSFPELYLDGGDKGDGEVEIRTRFLDTAFWAPDVTTDANGEATVQVTLPDNLTSWRATVIGATADTRVGKATANVRARKEIMVRLSTPGYMVQGDRVRITASVHNETGQPQPVAVDLTATGVVIEGETRQTVQVDGAAPKTLTWFARAEDPGQATFTITAKGTSKSDGMRTTIPIRTHGRLNVRFDAGELGSRATLEVTRLPGAVEGEVRLELMPSIGSAFLSSLDELVDYPYGCTEQTMSRFMPAVVVARTLRDLGLPRPDLEKKIPDVVRKSLARLKTLQHYDGGFGWWPNDQSEAYMTAYVLEGLARCQEAGYAVDPFIRDRALTWAKQELEKGRVLTAEEAKKWPYLVQRRREDRVYLAYATLLFGFTPHAYDVLVPEAAKLVRPEGPALGVSALAQLTMALGRRAKGDPNYASLRDNALGALRRLANASGSVASWPDEWGVLGTARALTALMEVAPQDPLIMKTIRYLMLARRGNSWFSTQDTAQVLVGLTGYLRSAKPGPNGYRYAVRIGGRSFTGSIEPGRVFERSGIVTVPIAELAEGANSIAIETEGSAGGFYSLSVRQTPPVDEIGALVNGSGLDVARTYHTLAPQKMEDGSMRLVATSGARTRFDSGEVLRCKIQIRTSRAFQFVMVEAPTPANFRVAESEYLDEWNWWFSGMSILDDKVVFFARYLEPGTHVIEYTLRAETPGKACALPALAYEMYAPETRGSCAEDRLEVEN